MEKHAMCACMSEQVYLLIRREKEENALFSHGMI